MQIIGGTFKGKKLNMPLNDESLRPTKSIVKQSAINMLIARCEFKKSNIADICCGIGSLGLESLSRGANHVTFIDKNTKWVKQNIGLLGAENQTTVINSDMQKFSPTLPFDIIITDPPYNMDMPNQLLKQKNTLGKQGTLWLLEAETGFNPIYQETEFQLLKQKSFGKSSLFLLEQL